MIHLEVYNTRRKCTRTVSQRSEGRMKCTCCEVLTLHMEWCGIAPWHALLHMTWSKHVVNSRAVTKGIASTATKPTAQIKWNLDVSFCGYGATLAERTWPLCCLPYSLLQEILPSFPDW